MRRAGSAGALARTACASTLGLRHPLNFFALRAQCGRGRPRSRRNVAS